jgi:hypothetical protein
LVEERKVDEEQKEVESSELLQIDDEEEYESESSSEIEYNDED